MGLRRRIFVGTTAFVIFLLLLEINSPADRLLQAATNRVFDLARSALDVLIAYS